MNRTHTAYEESLNQEVELFDATIRGIAGMREACCSGSERDNVLADLLVIAIRRKNAAVENLTAFRAAVDAEVVASENPLYPPSPADKEREFWGGCVPTFLHDLAATDGKRPCR